MLESTVDLLNGLFLIAMILLTAVCIVGSIVAALGAVSRGHATSGSIEEKFADDMGSQSGAIFETRSIGNNGAESHLEVSAPEDLTPGASPQTPIVGVIRIGTFRS
jgi:hypothetical protein